VDQGKVEKMADPLVDHLALQLEVLMVPRTAVQKVHEKELWMVLLTVSQMETLRVGHSVVRSVVRSAVQMVHQTVYKRVYLTVHKSAMHSVAPMADLTGVHSGVHLASYLAHQSAIALDFQMADH
jgi:hypothetical protein